MDAMKKKQDFADCAERLKSIADPERLRIVMHLFQGETNVSDLAHELGEEIVKVSHHLGVLRHAGVVMSEKQGRFVVYRLHPDVVVSGRGEERKIHFGCCSVDLDGKK
jgi:ArsR family transcriptional regulator